MFSVLCLIESSEKQIYLWVDLFFESDEMRKPMQKNVVTVWGILVCLLLFSSRLQAEDTVVEAEPVVRQFHSINHKDSEKEIDKLVNNPIHLKTLRMSYCEVLTGEDFAKLNRLHRLDELQLYYKKGNITPEQCAAIAKIPNLKSIELSGTYLTHECVTKFFVTKSITRLSLSGRQINDSTIRDVIWAFPHLVELHIGRNDCTDETCLWISKSKTIKKITLWSEKDYITYVGMSHFAKMKQLKHLTISSDIKDKGLKQVKGMKQLEVLMLGGKGITDKGMRYLEGLNQLKTFGLGGSSITDEGMKSIGKLTTLTNLNLTNPDVTDQGIRYLRPLSKLNYLNLSGNQITGAGFDALDTMQNLKKLELSRTTFDTRNAKYLSKLKRLKVLDISYLKPDPKGLYDNNEVGTLGTLSQVYEIYWDSNEKPMAELHRMLPKLYLTNSDVSIGFGTLRDRP